MAVIRFTTTRLSGLQAAGRLQEMQHSVIAPFLERELGQSYGRLFADFETEASDVRAWYVDADTKPRAIDDLMVDEQAALRQRVADMIAKILDFAGRIGAESPQKANLARILTAATTFPIEDLWEAGDQPIIVNWGFHRQSVPEGTPRQIQMLIAPRAEPRSAAKSWTPPPIPAAIGSAPPSGSLLRVLVPVLWCLFLGLLGSCYWLLLPACGIDSRWPILSELHVFNTCRARSPFDELLRDGTRLQLLVDQEELRLAQKRRQCLIDPPPTRRAEGPDHPAETVPQDPGKLDADIIQRLPRDTQRGDVEVSLLWDNEADLDLIIECPGGQKLWHDSVGFQACGGQLTRDVNKAGSDLLQHPIEDASWPTSPHGNFTIKVQLWTYNTVPPNTDIPFKIRIRRGDDVRIIEGGRIQGQQKIVTVTTTDL